MLCPFQLLAWHPRLTLWNFFVSLTRDTIACASVTCLFLSLTIFLFFTVNFTCVSPWVTGFTISAVSVFIAFLKIKYEPKIGFIESSFYLAHKILCWCHKSVCLHNLSFLHTLFYIRESVCHIFYHFCSQNLHGILKKNYNRCLW